MLHGKEKKLREIVPPLPKGVEIKKLPTASPGKYLSKEARYEELVRTLRSRINVTNPPDGKKSLVPDKKEAKTEIKSRDIVADVVGLVTKATSDGKGLGAEGLRKSIEHRMRSRLASTTLADLFSPPNWDDKETQTTKGVVDATIQHVVRRIFTLFEDRRDDAIHTIGLIDRRLSRMGLAISHHMTIISTALICLEDSANEREMRHVSSIANMCKADNKNKPGIEELDSLLEIIDSRIEIARVRALKKDLGLAATRKEDKVDKIRICIYEELAVRVFTLIISLNQNFGMPGPEYVDITKIPVRDYDEERENKILGDNVRKRKEFNSEVRFQLIKRVRDIFPRLKTSGSASEIVKEAMYELIKRAPNTETAIRVVGAGFKEVNKRCADSVYPRTVLFCATQFIQCDNDKQRRRLLSLVYIREKTPVDEWDVGVGDLREQIELQLTGKLPEGPWLRRVKQQLNSRDVSELMDTAGLTELEELAFRFYVLPKQGNRRTLMENGRIMGCSVGSVHSAAQRAWRKIERVM